MSLCSSCDKPFEKDEKKVTTDSGMKFHAACFKNLLSTRSKNDYQEDDTGYAGSGSAKKNDRSSEPSKHTKPTNEKQWECEKCSTNNLASEKRCNSCGKSRYARITSTVESRDTQNVEEEHDRPSSSAAHRSPDDYHHAKPKKKVTDYDDDDHAGDSGSSKSDYHKTPSKDKHRDPKYADPIHESDEDESSSSYKKAASSKQKKSTQPQSPSSSSSHYKDVVYIPDLPSDIVDNLQLEQLVSRRIEDILQIKPHKVKCYSKLGIGVVYVTDDQVKDRLLNKIGKLALDPKEGKYFITFIDRIELISYIVLEVTKDQKSDDLPTTQEISRRWADLHKGNKPSTCDTLNALFPNIYRIVSTSLNDLISVSSDGVFSIKSLIGHIYYSADCSFFDNLPRTITQYQIQDAIAASIGQSDLPPTSLYIQMNRHAATACIIAANVARLWSTKSFITIDKNTLQKTTKIACRLVVHPIPKSYSIQGIIKHREFNGAVTNHKLVGEQLILELSDKDIFERCIQRGALRIDNGDVVHMDLCDTSSNPDGSEIDDDTWYETVMLGIKPDIMQFVAKPKDNIFRYRWNPDIWKEQFKRVATQKRDDKQAVSHDQKNPTPDQMRHLLRVTVMLNTLAAIRRRCYMIDDREIKLNLKRELKTIIYDHRSKLERSEKLPLAKTPYSRTTVRVLREDCLIAYEHMAKKGKRPVLLNMASATSPGGGFRKGDGAQEENIFRRSDYCRSLDVGLDEFLNERADRFHCSSSCNLDRISDENIMYPMNEYGAIYTSGITVFRQSEEPGYAYMETPLENVCSIAMAAYRDPDVKANMLAPKFAVGTRKKIENIFAIAYHHKHDCLILSALGCGAFKNPPDHVAKLFLSVIEQYAGFFESIIFAIVDDHNAGRHLNPEGNYSPFAKVLDDKVVEPSTTMNKPNTMIGPYRLLSDGSTVGDVTILDLPPCNFGAKCTEIYNHNHASKFSHPSVCIQAAVDGKCKRIDDPVHTTSFIHRNQCREGGECPQINDDNHSRQFDHPDYCLDGGKCHNQKEEHLKQYRHLPLCEKSHRCMEYQKEVASHCNKYRHCIPSCPHGRCCAMFHDKSHIGEFQHPFPTPCPRTPFDCPYYAELSESKNITRLPPTTQQHCLEFAHVCKHGRNCTDKTSLHLSKTIHIARHLCPYNTKCKKLNDEEHLNSFTHSNIPDFRPICPHAEKCRDLRKNDHKITFRHPTASENGVVKYYGSNEGTNFVENQKDNMTCVEDFIRKNKWKPLPSGTIPDEILNWLHTVQPIHRCSPIIFESILLHGHAMSREYMEHLKDPAFVANSVLNHSQIQNISALKIKTYVDSARLYVTALINLEFNNSSFTGAVSAALPTGDDASTHKPYSTEHLTKIINREENKLSKTLSNTHMNALKSKAIEIAQASIKLHSDPAGIGHAPDKALGTDKLVFSILGPHLGHYYGDVIIVFKREILHHPDANFSIQAATSFPSGNAYKWRPWLGDDPKDPDERVKHYHRTKLHASVPGYDYAAALELMVLASMRLKKTTMDINLDQILDQWVDVDSHQNIEAHLPQLIPLDYIDHIYIPENLFKGLNENALTTIDAIFKHRITLVQHDGEADHEKGPFGPTPKSKSRSKYQNFVVKELLHQYKQNAANSLSKSMEGIVITIPSMTFDDPFVLPLTITQAYAQYRLASSRPSKDNITYIYWKTMKGDMMLTLSNEEIDPIEKQPHLRCLICYIAPKSKSNDNHYFEHTSYLSSGHPFQHEMILSNKTYATGSNTFYTGCNTHDFITYCLELHRSSGKVILSHVGSNGIYNNEEMSCTFNRSVVDLNKLEYIHISAGSHTVPVRNLMIYFEKQTDMHPTFDKDFKPDTSAATGDRPANTRDKEDPRSGDNAHQNSSSKATNDQRPKSPGVISKFIDWVAGDKHSPLKPCPNNINCLIQYSEDGADHNAKYSHPCRFSELCRDKEPYLTHEPHSVPMCRDDRSCSKLDDPSHRASRRHTGWPDFLIPCPEQRKCGDKSSSHRNRYSHGEQVFETSPVSEPTRTRTPPKHQYNPEPDDHNDRIECKWGTQCHDYKTAHRAKYSHPSETKSHQPQDDHKIPCKWGTRCHDNDSHHRAKYYHPK